MTSVLNRSLGVTVLITLAVFSGSAQKPELIVQTGHLFWVQTIAYSPDGRLLASAGDKTIKLWDTQSGKELRTFKGFSSDAISVAFSPDGKALAGAAGEAGLTRTEVRLWDVASGAELQTLPAAGPVAWSGDGKLLVTICADDSKSLTVWDCASHSECRERGRLTGHAEKIISVAFSQRWSVLATANLGEFGKPEIKLWDAKAGVLLRTIDGGGPVALNADGKVVAGTQRKPGGEVRGLKLWDTDTGREIREVKGLMALAFASDGRLAYEAIVDNGTAVAVVVMDPATGSDTRVFRIRAAARTAAFSPDGKFLASAGEDAAVTIWDLTTGDKSRLLTWQSNAELAIAISPDGRTIATGNGDYRVKLWDTSSNHVRTLAGDSGYAGAMAFSPDGRILATGTNPGLAATQTVQTITLWDVSAGAVFRKLPGHLPATRSVAFSPDGKLIASCGGMFPAGMDFPRAVTLWDVAKGKEIFAFHELQDLPYAVAFSPDGKTLAVATADAGRRGALIFIDVLTGRATDKLESNVAFQTVTYNPTGRMLAATLDDGALWLLDVATHATVHTLKSRPLMPPVFSPDGRVLAAASTGPKDTITLWNVDSGSEVATLSGHFREIHRLAFTPDGKMLVSTSGDTTVRTWDVATGQELLTLLSFGQNDWLAVTPDGLFDGSPVAWNQIFWRFSPSLFDVAPLEYFFTDFYEPGLMTEIFAGKRPRATSDIAQKDRRQPQLQLSVPAASEPQLSARNATVRIDVSDAPAGARDLRLFRNGSLVKVWGGDVLKGQKSVTLGTTIPIVAGENRLTAYAFNHDNVKSSDATVTVTGAESLKRKGTLHILAIGVSRYANGDYDLDYTTDDATSFASQLKLQQEKLAHYQSVEIKTLLNENATKANILAELKSLSTAVQPEDAVVVYFSGHGKADGDHFYLVTHDLGYSGPRDQLSSEGLRQILMHSISDVELEEGFRGIDAGQMFMIIDACNSGQALENKDEPRRGPMNTRGLAQLAYEKGMYIMTASQSVEEAFVSEKLKHSYLTYALVEEGLKTKAADADHNGEVVLREWFDYALARVPTLREETLQSKSLVEVTPAVKAARSRKSQTPRVFYRREPDARPLVVAQVGASK